MKNQLIKSLSVAFSIMASSGEYAAAQQSMPVKSQPALSEQAQLARDYTLSRGRQNFLILDKNNAEIIGFENGQEAFRSKIFLGKLRGDNLSPNLGVTPAGAFNAEVREIKKTPKDGAFERYGSYIPYNCIPGKVTVKKNVRIVNPDICYSIHPTLKNAQEQRALQIGSADARRISNACVRDTDYKTTADFIRRHSGKMLLVILPYDVSKTRDYLKIPANYSNQPN